MGDTWIALSDISNARSRLSTLPMSKVSQPYERLQPFEDNERMQHGHEPSRSDGPSPLPTKLDPRGHDRTRPRTYWFKKAFWIQTWHDVRQLPWRRISHRCLLGVLPPFAFLGLLVLLILMSVLPDLFVAAEEGGCTPDGDFEVLIESDRWSRAGLYTPWTRASLFAVNIKFGRYSFAMAKLIDVAWDVGIGRGGQVVLGLVSYATLTGVIRHIMGESLVHYRTFKAITLQNDSMASLGNLTKGMWVERNYRLKIAISWMIVAGVFILLPPTWVSAMTGYTAAVTPMTLNGNGARVSSEKFLPVVYKIHDGARLRGDFTNETMIVVPWSNAQSDYMRPFFMDYDGTNGCIYYYDMISSGDESDERIVWYNETTLDCKKMWAVSKYVDQYGLLGKTVSDNTTFQRPDETNITTEIHLSPTLNISAYFAVSDEQLEKAGLSGYEPDYAWYERPAGRSWEDPDTSEKPFSIPNPMFWDRDSDTTYNLTEFEKATRCQPEGVIEYRWGFSFLLLFAYIVAFLLWSIGMWLLYLHKTLHTDPGLPKRELGIERAVLEVAQAMEKTLDPAMVRRQGNSELKALADDVQLSYMDLRRPDETTREREAFSFRQWLKDEIWWLIALCFCTIMFSLSIAGHRYLGPVVFYIWVAWSPWFSSLPTIGILLVLAAGRDVKSRWVLAVPFLLLFLGLDVY